MINKPTPSGKSPMLARVYANLSKIDRTGKSKMRAHARKPIKNIVYKAAGSRFARLFSESSMSARESKFWNRAAVLTAIFGIALCAAVEWYGAHVEAEIAEYFIEDAHGSDLQSMPEIFPERP